MIKVEANQVKVVIEKAEGNGPTLMVELCCIVDAVCTAWCSDEDDGIKQIMRASMIKTIADALLEENWNEKDSE